MSDSRKDILETVYQTTTYEAHISRDRMYRLPLYGTRMAQFPRLTKHESSLGASVVTRLGAVMRCVNVKVETQDS